MEVCKTLLVFERTSSPTVGRTKPRGSVAYTYGLGPSVRLLREDLVQHKENICFAKLCSVSVVRLQVVGFRLRVLGSE